MMPRSRIASAAAARRNASSSAGNSPALTPLRRVVSAEPVLRPAIAGLAGLLAERYAGTRADVLRLAVPPRHATTEKQPSAPEEPVSVDRAAADAAWRPYPAADAFLTHLAGGGSPRAVWAAVPG